MGPSKISRWRRWGFLVLSAITSGLGSSSAAAESPGPGSTPEATTPAPPIVITAGGTYTGSWQSLDPNVPAVRVFTSAPVIIENCTVSSVTDGITTGIGSNVTIRNCRGYALNPNVAGTPKGSFALGYNFASLIVEHNLIEGFRFGAIAINDPPEALETFSGQRVAYKYNLVHNLDGRFSDGHGGYQTGNFAQGTSVGTGAFQLAGVRNADVEIAWNEIINQPYVSQPEDVISTAESRGLPGRPIHIHDNYIQGDNPANAAVYETFGGGGIQLGDSPSKTDVGYTNVHDNQVVNFASQGISISSGHHNDVHDNRIVSARTLPDGTPLNNQWRLPMQLHDYYWDPNYNMTTVADPLWHDNWMHDNAFAAVQRDGAVAINTFHHLSPTVGQYNNTDALGHLATTADEQAEYARWKQKLIDNGITVGVIGDPAVTIADASVTEGDSGIVSLAFTVSLSPASALPVTVDYTVTGGMATADADFIASSPGTLTFAPGITTRTITVPVIGDRLNEGSETLLVNLSNPVNASIVDPQGVGTILDDDLPGFAISDAVIAEPHNGTANATFTVALSPPAAGTTTVSYATADGSASAPADYTATAGVLTFLAGQTSQAISVPVRADALPEASETFFADLLGSSGPLIVRSRGTATIYEAGFYSVSPCRVLDTRVDGQGPALVASKTRTAIVAGRCGVPVAATAVSLNVTVVSAWAPGDLRIFPAKAGLPLVSTINYGAGQTRANNATVALSVDGLLSILCEQATGSAELILDVNGYFE